MTLLAEDFYARDTETVARDLIGKIIEKTDDDGRRLTARIVETEAYTDDDPASHSFRGPTPRNSVMFGPPGYAYVYLIYGIYECFNVVTGQAGHGEAVLIRAAEPLEGADIMWKARFPTLPFRPDRTHLLLRGPGNLCRALSITRAAFNGASLLSGSLTIRTDDSLPPVVETGVRIGIRAGTAHLRRYYIPGNMCVSGPRRGNRAASEPPEDAFPG